MLHSCCWCFSAAAGPSQLLLLLQLVRPLPPLRPLLPPRRYDMLVLESPLLPNGVKPAQVGQQQQQRVLGGAAWPEGGGGHCPPSSSGT